MPTATLTSKGQITIPSSVRNRLGLRTGDRIAFILEPGGGVHLATQQIPFEDLRGVFRRPGKKPATLEVMDRGIEAAIRSRGKRTRARTS